MNPLDCKNLYESADAAGRKAAEACTPTPMIVSEADPLSGTPKPNGKAWYVADGACGFAWIKVRPGNCTFARWLKANKGARKGYYGGMELWVSDYNQSIARKEAYASAFAGVIREAGIKAYAESRLD